MKFGASGLTWTGCDGDVALTAILVVVAVILAVVAYNKARGEDAIRADYYSKKRIVGIVIIVNLVSAKLVQSNYSLRLFV